MRRTDPLIVGGGPAGSAAAIALAKTGARPLLLERHADAHDGLCGGFLSWRTLETLQSLDLDPETLGGHAIDRLALFAGESRLEADLPDRAMGLSRRRLDALLRERAGEFGATIRTGTAARSVEADGTVRLADGALLRADALFLATGKSELRGAARPIERAGDRDWMGLRYRLAPSERLTAMVGGSVELHLFAGGYAGLLLQEDGSGNLCLALRRRCLAEAGGEPGSFLDGLAARNPALARRIEASGEILSSDAVGLVPYGWRAETTAPGLFRLGDQAAVIPSLAGEGMGLALASGTMAADAWRRGGPEAAPQFQRAFAARAKRPLAIAGAIKRLAERPGLAAAGFPLARLPGLIDWLGRSTRIAA